MIGEETREQLREIVARYPSARSAMLPCLHLVQEVEGYVTPDGVQAVAEAVGAKPDEVESVVTFYSMYTEAPLGKNMIKVCTSISCYLRGCDDLMHHFEQKLGIRNKQTTKDGMFTLEGVECLAACGMAPVLQVNQSFVENVTSEMADELIERLRRGESAESIRSDWQVLGDGAGMATKTTFGSTDSRAKEAR